MQTVNAVFSYLLRQPVGLGLGSRGFSRRAAELILRNSQPEGWGDAKWPLLVRRAGWDVTYLAVDGVDWESPDFHRAELADPPTRQRVADEYDLKADRRASRVRNGPGDHRGGPCGPGAAAAVAVWAPERGAGSGPTRAPG